MIRRENKDCDHWPECEECVLVKLYLVKLPHCWDVAAMDYECEGDKYQLATLVHSHIVGKCGGYCLFCEVERIPI